MDNWLSPELLSSIPLIGGMAAWVGRTSSRVTTTEREISDFKDAFQQHMKDDAKAHERIARMEGTLTEMNKSLARIETRIKK